MSWSFSDSHLDFSQDCINFDGDNKCPTGSGIDVTDGLPDTHLGFKPAPSPFKEQLERFLLKHQEIDESRSEGLEREEDFEEIEVERPVFLESLSQNDAQIIEAKFDLLIKLSEQDKEALLMMEDEDLIVFLLLI